MGGPCYLIYGDEPNDSGEKFRTRGPPCTDNFQYVKFQFQGKEWHSVEQCFQAVKFPDTAIQEGIRLTLKRSPDETDGEHGHRVWREGRRFSSIRPDWDRVKIDLMYEICLAKVMCNPQLQEELLQTGNATIEGGLSTGWNHPTMKHQSWTYWNGIIQMRVREMIKPVEKRRTDFLKHVEELFKKYREGYDDDEKK